MRGNLQYGDIVDRADRSIPACAGEPVPAVVTGEKVTVYPRVCGGTALLKSPQRISQGLSPRVRGNHQWCTSFLLRLRSIPACAGEPCWDAVPPEIHEVYPRVCGGTGNPVFGYTDQRGLSPRVRGNRYGGGDTWLRDGSIPACAGEPLVAMGGERGRGVYPRVCGGTLLTRRPWPFSIGLSPRVRGNPDVARRTEPRLGSIPACAGEPSFLLLKRRS